MARFGRSVRALGMALGLLAAFGCGNDETIRVDLLPPGNARGSSASGLYHLQETVASSDCPASVTVGTVEVNLPQVGEEYEACVEVTQDDGYLALNFVEFLPGTPEVTRPAYLADGGLYQEGQFRVGGLFAFHAGVTARVLLDGQYNPPMGATVVQSFEGVELIQVYTTEEGGEQYLCEYQVEPLTGDRSYDCGDS